jgi:hypothetical protein
MNFKAEIEGIRREMRSIRWLLWAALAGVAVLVVRAYCWPPC